MDICRPLKPAAAKADNRAVVLRDTREPHRVEASGGSSRCRQTSLTVSIVAEPPIAVMNRPASDWSSVSCPEGVHHGLDSHCAQALLPPGRKKRGRDIGLADICPRCGYEIGRHASSRVSWIALATTRASASESSVENVIRRRVVPAGTVGEGIAITRKPRWGRPADTVIAVCGFGEGSHLDLCRIAHFDNAEAMHIIRHQPGARLLGEPAECLSRRNVAAHLEHGLGQEQHLPLRFTNQPGRIGNIIVRERADIRA